MLAALPAGRLRFGLVAVLALGVLAACSSVPDWANPVAWYDDVFSESVDPADVRPQTQSTSEARERLEEAQKAPEPRVGSVPDRPQTSTREERNTVMRGLAADRDAARYTDEELRGQPASTANLALPPAPSTPAPAEPPAQASAPTPSPTPPAGTAVTTAPLPPQPGTTTAPAAPTAVATAPAAPAPVAAAPVAAAPPAPTPLMAAPQPVAPTLAPVAPPVAAYGTPTPSPATTRPVATMPPPPTYAPVAPIRDNTVLQSTYQSALSQSAATVTTAPANAAFANPRPAPLQRPATVIPSNVLQVYQETTPPAAYVAAPPVVPAGNRATPFGSAGSRLAGTIDFRAGSATLDRRDRETVSSALADHNTRGGTIRVVGYAPAGASGTSQLKAFRLSQDRANAVANELVKAGAERQYVFVEGRGQSPGGNADRVEVYLEN
jgi:outer membrane protein OmpA-like peptidoglycan-associated protein